MIRLLPDEVVDRIAAGEVVERPAAVVKELIENALDAGASRIAVRLEAGGRRLIRVEDDGEGMTPDDLEKVFLRHATSKLRDVEDLFHIASLGFRGEALASIGAVSRTQIMSRPDGAAEGALVANDGGKVLPPKPAGCPPGTAVEVRNLFYNVPVRSKFLKTEATELSHCMESVTRFALSHPGIGFTLLHNGREVFRVEQNTGLKDRISAFFDKKVAEALIPVNKELLGIHLEGFLGRPELGRRDMRRSYLFLNDRFIRDRAVHAALRRADREVMPEKFHPVYFLKVGMPPDWVDVNVHPTKIEVRFLDGARVFSAVHKTVAEALAGGEKFSSAAGPPDSPSYAWRPGKSFGSMEPRGDAGPAVREAPCPGNLSFTSGASTPDRTMAAADETAPESPEVRPSRSGRILQVHETYAVFETPSGLGIVDQHALHERILYEDLRKEYEGGGIRLQKLLLPVTVDLEPARAARVSEICFALNHLGIRAEASGERGIKVSAVPALLKNSDPHALVSEVIDRVAEGGMGEDAYRGLLFSLACRAAVKAGDRLADEELLALLERAEQIAYSGRCPHGRPTMVHLSLAELEVMFKRRGF